MRYVDEGEDIGREQNDGYLHPKVPKILTVATVSTSYEPLREEVSHDENQSNNVQLDLSDLSKYILTWDDVAKMRLKEQEEKEQKRREVKEEKKSDENEKTSSSQSIAEEAASDTKQPKQEEGEADGENVTDKELKETPSEDDDQKVDERKKHPIRPAKIENDELEVVRHKLLAASYVTGGSDLGKLFNEIDTDEDGVISLEELTHTVIRLVPDMTDAKLFTIMKIADIKGTGVLDKEDFYWFVGHTKPPPENDRSDEDVAEALITRDGEGDEGYDEGKKQDEAESKTGLDEIREDKEEQENDTDEGRCKCYHTQFYSEPFSGKMIATNDIAPWKMDYNEFTKNNNRRKYGGNGAEYKDDVLIDQKGVDDRHYSSPYNDAKGSDGEDSIAVILETIPVAEKKPQIKGEDDRKGSFSDKAYDTGVGDSKYAADSK